MRDGTGFARSQPPGAAVRIGPASRRAVFLIILVCAAAAGAQAPSDPHASGGTENSGRPRVEQVCAVAPDILAITIMAQAVEHPALQPYAPAAGDVTEDAKDALVWTWDPSTARFRQVHERTVSRVVDGRRRLLGTLSPDGISILAPDRLMGQPLDVHRADDPDSYRISALDDPAFRSPMAPLAVLRKSKPVDVPAPSQAPPWMAQPLEHHLYLRLPHPLREAATYHIALPGLQTAPAELTYQHLTTQRRSEAVHAIQTGYRPDDPAKVAYVSIWLGTGGGYQHPDLRRFEVRDDQDAIAFTGTPVLTKALGATEQLWRSQDYARTAVWRLDFSAMQRPGTYRVCVPGIGCSGPFAIGVDVWRQAFTTAMRSFVTQRDGLALEAPWASFHRPRPFHPDDGVRFFQLTIPVQAGQEGARGDNLVALQQAGTLQEVHGVWGGYMDAGDWDTLASHLTATELLLELVEMFPAFAASTHLSLPPSECRDAIPGILHEALWNLACFRRLQLADGGVRGGYGEGWGARAAETSWMAKAAGVYAPDPETSLLYAGCAAKASRLLQAYDVPSAHVYSASAEQAWQWASHHAPETVSPRWRAFAAVELYATTRKPTYRDAFLALTELRSPGPFIEQPEASFTYARLPAALVDPRLREAAVSLFASAADRAIAFAAHNAFGITTDRTDLPMISWVGYFSTPGMSSQNLPRAHFLTKDPRHLAAVIESCTFALGANPDNRTFTVGVGHAWPRHPLHLDSRRTGQPAPVGITVYGPGDEANAMSRGENGWIHQWFTLGMTPDWYAWPPQESQLDIFAAAKLDEFTIAQQLGPVSYTWGYLAARP